MPNSLASALAEALVDGGWRAKARPEQLEPDGDHNGWLVLSGRGWGKTRCGAEWIIENALAGTASHIALIAPTAADARDVMVEGPSGILSIAPAHARPLYEPSKRRLTWPNGAVATTFSAEEADRLRGPNHDLLWADEVAAWQDAQAVWDMAMFGLRLGSRPRWLVTTTPKPIPLLQGLLKRSDVVTTRGSTFDNAANLAPSFLRSIRERYEGTRLGRQELLAEMLEDVEGALWNRAILHETRLPAGGAPDDLCRIVVAIDPAVTAGAGSDETGIVVAGADNDGHGFILEDASFKGLPHEWARRAIEAYRLHKADLIVAEANQGGEMVRSTIHSIDRNVAVKLVHASRGKITRAEPVSALYEQGRIHHVGGFPALEDQLCGFAPGLKSSPDRLDALVWALTELFLTSSAGWGFYEFARRELAEENANVTPAEPIRREFAPGSVEWAAQQAQLKEITP